MVRVSLNRNLTFGTLKTRSFVASVLLHGAVVVWVCILVAVPATHPRSVKILSEPVILVGSFELITNEVVAPPEIAVLNTSLSKPVWSEAFCEPLILLEPLPPKQPEDVLMPEVIPTILFACASSPTSAEDFVQAPVANWSSALKGRSRSVNLGGEAKGNGTGTGMSTSLGRNPGGALSDGSGASKIGLVTTAGAGCGSGHGHSTSVHVKKRVECEYPYSVRVAGKQGVVRVMVEVLVSGQVGKSRVEETSGEKSFDQAALRAAVKWQFTPATRDGVFVTSWVQLTYRFVLQAEGQHQ
ncbi:MAG: energy transducer TonB [Planctomycetota bacterium]